MMGGAGNTDGYLISKDRPVAQERDTTSVSHYSNVGR